MTDLLQKMNSDEGYFDNLLWARETLDILVSDWFEDCEEPRIRDLFGEHLDGKKFNIEGIKSHSSNNYLWISVCLRDPKKAHKEGRNLIRQAVRKDILKKWVLEGSTFDSDSLGHDDFNYLVKTGYASSLVFLQGGLLGGFHQKTGYGSKDSPKHGKYKFHLVVQNSKNIGLFPPAFRSYQTEIYKVYEKAVDRLGRLQEPFDGNFLWRFTKTAPGKKFKHKESFEKISIDALELDCQHYGGPGLSVEENVDQFPLLTLKWNEGDTAKHTTWMARYVQTLFNSRMDELVLLTPYGEALVFDVEKGWFASIPNFSDDLRYEMWKPDRKELDWKGQHYTRITRDDVHQLLNSREFKESKRLEQRL